MIFVVSDRKTIGLRCAIQENNPRTGSGRGDFHLGVIVFIGNKDPLTRAMDYRKTTTKYWLALILVRQARENQ